MFALSATLLHIFPSCGNSRARPIDLAQWLKFSAPCCFWLGGFFKCVILESWRLAPRWLAVRQHRQMSRRRTFRRSCTNPTTASSWGRSQRPAFPAPKAASGRKTAWSRRLLPSCSGQPHFLSAVTNRLPRSSPTRKGQMVAIEQASVQKKCNIQFQGKPPA